MYEGANLLTFVDNVSISNGGVRIDAPEVWGALHGLISVAQLARSTIVGEVLCLAHLG